MRLRKYIFFLLAIIAAGLYLLISIKAAAKAPVKRDFAPQYAVAATPAPEAQAEPKAPARASQVAKKGVQGAHPVKAGAPADPAKIKNYLEAKKSPLAPYSDQLAASDYWSSIIAICNQEQHGCSKAPSWNYWGLKGTGDCGRTPGGFAKFCNAESAITEIKKRMVSYELRFGSTLEAWRGKYCYDGKNKGGVCSNWESSILAVKAKLENL